MGLTVPAGASSPQPGNREDLVGLGAELLRPAAREQFVHHLIKAKAGRFLTGREFLKGSQKCPHICLSGNQQKGMINQPVIIGIGGDMPSLIGISAQIEHQGNS